MHVLFVEPAFPQNQREFPRALHRVGARVTGIGERSYEHLDPELKGWLDAYEQVPSVVHEDALFETVRRCQRRGWVDRLEATVEAHVMPTARVREACGIPGTSVETAFLCRDKPAMKQALREAGLPCAQSVGAASAAEARAFAERVGFPLILKPPSSAGAEGTYKAHDAGELERILDACGVDAGAPVAVEEFIEGHEGFYDTVSAGGRVVHEFISHYYPNVLEAMRERWISPQFVTTNRVDAPGYREVRELGHAVIRTLGIGTSATHMEWFYGPRGLKFSEIGCRPPGVGAWDVYCAANEMDVYAEWARTVCQLPPGETPSRRFAAGHVALRPDRDGRIAGYSGLDELQRRHGAWIFASHFPPAGSPTQPIEAGFKANAWVRLRHPDYDRLREMLDDVAHLVRVHAR
jgi:formate-dependent phosphoribosylglycinamide formyltransferase (GAR transformylase)